MKGLVKKVRSKIKRIVPETRFLLGRMDPVDALHRYRYRRTRALAFPIPPKVLRTMVGPEPRIERFLDQGRRTSEDVRRALEAVGRPLESFRSILDFGCGCGRQMRWLAEMPRSCRLHGTDILAPAIEWNRRHLHFAEFEVNNFYPPLGYTHARFDLIYAISVFTHLNEPDQQAWMDELKRVAQAGGIVMVTTQGEYALEHFRKGTLPASPEFLARLNRHRPLSEEGVIFEPYEPGMNYGLAFHDVNYVRERWGRKLRLLRFIPKGMDGWQDIVVMQKEGLN